MGIDTGCGKKEITPIIRLTQSKTNAVNLYRLSRGHDGILGLKNVIHLRYKCHLEFSSTSSKKLKFGLV